MKNRCPIGAWRVVVSKLDEIERDANGHEHIIKSLPNILLGETDYVFQVV